MKVSDFLEKPFPSEDGYRLMEISQIFYWDIGDFKLQLVFHKVSDARSKLTSNKKALRIHENLGSDQTFKTNCSIAFQRLFVVGSIWWNKGSVQAVAPSSYLEYCSISDVFLESNSVIQTNTSIFQESFEFNDKRGDDVITRNASILMYELESTLYEHRTENNEHRFFKHQPKWQVETIDFVAFDPSEIHRYFFSSKNPELTDFNSRLLIPQFNSLNSPEDNWLFDPKQSKIKDGKHNVYLRNKKDLLDSDIIGNLAYQPLFRDKVRKMQNVLNLKKNEEKKSEQKDKGYYFFSSIEGLPIISFSRMKGYAFRVTRNDGKRGLYFVQLHAFSKTIDHSYTPIIPDKDGEVIPYPGGGGSGGNGGTPKGDPEEKLDIDYGGGSNPKDKPVETDALGLDELFNPVLDVVIEEPVKDKLDEDKKLPDGKGGNGGEGGETVSPPGLPEQEPGHTPVIRETVRARDYFDHFPNILREVALRLEKKKYSISLSFYSQNLLTEPIEEVIKCNKLSIDHGSNEDNWSLYLAVIKVALGSANRYYYLFEKTSATKVNSRTWLYAEDSYKVIWQDKLLDKIHDFLYEDFPTKADRVAPNNKFNHKQRETIIVNGVSKDVQIRQEDAIEHQIEKITSRILKTFES